VDLSEKVDEVTGSSCGVGREVAPPHCAGVDVGCESIQWGQRRSMLMVSASGIAVEL
jgi:hypothetical protein